MNVAKSITIDLNSPRREVVHLGQGDNTRQITLTLMKDGLPYDVTDDIGTATLVAGVQYIKANGVGGYYDWTSTDIAAVIATSAANVWTVNIDEHVTDFPGFAEIFVKFSVAAGETLHSFPIILDVCRTESGATDPGEPYYQSASFLLKAQQATKTAAMTQRVGVDDVGRLWVKPGEGGGGGTDLPELYNGDLGKVLMAVDSGEDAPVWGVAFDTPVSVTITRDGSTYSVPSGTYATLSAAIGNERVVVAYTTEGLAQFAGVEGTALKFQILQDVGDNMCVVRYKISSGNSVTRTVWVVDNSAITPAGIGAAYAVTVETVTGSTPSITPVANHTYVCGEVAGLQITSSYAATGDWSVEFDTPTNVACSVDLPSGLKTIPATPEFANSKHIEINCHNGFAVVAEW